jgi:hypothetical protein
MAVNMQTHCTTYATVRTLIVEKKSPLDSFNTDGFQDNDASISASSFGLVPCNAMANTDKFRVVYDKTTSVNPTQQGAETKTTRFYVPMTGQMKYDGVSPASTGRELLFVFIPRRSDGSSTAGSIKLNVTSRFYFKDA